ncbi:Malic enzyme, NAD-binding [Cynara cardunculus var. scolymus]|uniref:Malic enzyme, NAD-binding n=1 Tax=Cynara cardunculus var. scolymus TaxID=59895 RepID=A0A118JTT2_CYNCS|nr:Malic enzyme, NAD-binding [Cynara cardunculus var. scolymus]
MRIVFLRFMVTDVTNKNFRTAQGLASQVTDEDLAKGIIYPSFSCIRKISANIAAYVAAKAYDLGLASYNPRPEDLVKFAERCMYSPTYPNYR